MKLLTTLFSFLLIAGVIAGLLSFSSAISATKPADGSGDSLKLAGFIEKIEAEEFDFEKDLTEEEKYTFHHSIEGTWVYRSADNYFTIYGVEVYQCNGWGCENSTFSYIELNKTGKVFDNDGYAFLSSIDTVYKLPDGKYLVLQKQGDNVKFFGEPAQMLRATLFSLGEDSLKFHTIPYFDNYWERVNRENSWDVYQPWYIDNNDFYLIYLSKQKKLSYCFGVNAERVGFRQDSAYVYKGYFEYVKGEFVHRKETKEFIGSDLSEEPTEYEIDTLSGPKH